MDGPLHLTAAHWLELDGKPLAIFREIAGLEPRSLQGQDVIVDGKPYRVRRVGTFAIMDATGTAFDLQLEPR